MKKILIISYHFPPSMKVGGKRVSNFAKMLPAYGWESYVLTIKDHYLRELDLERLKDLNTVRVFKAGQLPNIRQIYLKLKVLCFSIFKRRYFALDELEELHVQTKSDVNPETPFQRLKYWLISLFIMLPDEERSWIIPAAFRAFKVIKLYKINCIVTSSPPHSVQLIGLLVKKITGVKWIADFRDPWMTPPPNTLALEYRTALAGKIELWMERKVMQNADIVLTTNKAICNMYKKSFNAVDSSKFFCVTNGFDLQEYDSLKHLNKYEKFTLVYAGSLYCGRSPEAMFKAIRALILEGKLNVNDVRIKLVGYCGYVDNRPTKEIIESYGLGSVVEVSEQVPYSRSLEIIKQSHLALLLATNQPFQVPAKIYDYIGLGVKTLALTEQGATADLVKSNGVGQAFSFSDIEGIKKFIYQAFRDKDLPLSQSSMEVISKYDTRSIVKDLASLLDKAAS